MTFTRVLASLALVGFVAACGAESAPAAPTSDVDWMAFQGDTGIGVVRTDGTDARWPAEAVPSLRQTNPDWSPDGTRLVFAATNVFGADDLWTVGLDGAAPTQILACTSPCLVFDDPAWSPDGTKVLYSRRAEDGKGRSRATLETVTVADGTVEVLLTAEPDEGFAGPRWSPDGTRAVFELVRAASPAFDADVEEVTLMVIDPSAPETSQRALTDPMLFAATADWSPDGQLIVFSALPVAGAAAPDLFTIAPDGSGLTRITTTADEGGSAEEPAWSVDGSTIYFKHTTADDVTGLAVVAKDGGAVAPAYGETEPAGRHPRLHAAA